MINRLPFIVKIADNMFSLNCSGARALALVFVVFGIAGVNARAPSRIVGGSDADPGEIPWQASIRSHDTHICGGTIIGKKHILTGAHCIVGIVEAPYTDISVVTGSNTLEPGAGKAYGVKDVKVHEHYVERTSFTPPQNDIAVITLTDEIVENEYEKAVALPNGEVPSGGQGVVSGFGQSDRKNEELSPILQKLTVIVLGKTQCAAKGIYIERYQMCGLKALSSGSCKGDDGGPLVYNGTVVGIVSVSPGLCGIGVPDIYTRVDYYTDFIQNAMVEISPRIL